MSGVNDSSTLPSNDPVIIYKLQLYGNKWYVGSTTSLKARCDAHMRGRGAAWTKRHKPIRMHTLGTVSSNAGLEEDKQVLILMELYGVDNVRGGSYSQVTLSPAQKAEIDVKLNHNKGGCITCGSRSHFVARCPHKSNDSPQVNVKHCERYGRDSHDADMCRTIRDTDGETIIDPCERCGRDSHDANACYASRDIDGETIIDPCERCGRDSHDANACYASRDIDGETIIDPCERCGRDSHDADTCYARRHKNGNRLSSTRK
jgi:hypothetical protein